MNLFFAIGNYFKTFIHKSVKYYTAAYKCVFVYILGETEQYNRNA